MRGGGGGHGGRGQTPAQADPAAACQQRCSTVRIQLQRHDAVELTARADRQRAYYPPYDT